VVNAKSVRLAAILLLLAFCSGCMYQREIHRQQANPAFVREEIDRVASAVKQYYQVRGFYPIKNSDQATPKYEKYIIDLNRLVQAQFLSSIPKNAYEAGGRYYYLLINPETTPTVKLMDLVWVQETADLQQAVHEYAASNGGAWPAGAKTAPGFFAIDEQALKRKPLHLQSPYSNQYLPLLLHESGEVLIDYSLDIMKAARQNGAELPADGEDARGLLLAASPISPIRSYPYVWTNGEPVLSAP
jgi:hypothetical protein